MGGRLAFGMSGELETFHYSSPSLDFIPFRLKKRPRYGICGNFKRGKRLGTFVGGDNHFIGRVF